jgi:hypothetical protein
LLQAAHNRGYDSPVPAIAPIARMMRHHRRLWVAAGIALALGVVALNAHAALPEHHHHHGEETMCAASLSIAVAAGALAFAWRGPARVRTPRPMRRRELSRGAEGCAKVVLPRARAGPVPTLQALRR